MNRTNYDSLKETLETFVENPCAVDIAKDLAKKAILDYETLIAIFQLAVLIVEYHPEMVRQSILYMITREKQCQKS